MKLPKLHPLWLLTVSAIALRLVLFLGRGDYVAFDEGWYLLLGRNLMTGAGYTLSGLQHVALSPLFPVLSGAFGVVVDHPVWGGRIVAAVAGGLLVVPCWFVFERLGGRTIALIGCSLIAVMPSLAPFVAPYWIGWDLWVGAEPVLHLFLFTGIALYLRALDRQRALDWGLTGLTFGLAYLARPEAIIVFGLLGAASVLVFVQQRALRKLSGVLLLAAGFALAAAPYSIYLHSVLGRWTLTGRLIAATSTLKAAVPKSQAPAQTRLVENLLWRDQKTYVRDLYALDATRTRLADGYWGLSRTPAPVSTVVATSSPVEAGTRAAPPVTTSSQPSTASGPSPLLFYPLALAAVVPWYLLPLILVGVLPRRDSSLRGELVFALPLVGASLIVAFLIASDPRTQIMIVPLAVFYAARGIVRIGTFAETRLGEAQVRRGMSSAALAVIVGLLLLGTEARWLYFSLTMGSPHHLVGAENRRVGESLQKAVPEGAPVMSYHPALALYARRDWRVLPQAEFRDVLRYANAIGSEYIMLSPYYPSPVRLANDARDHVLLRVPPGTAAGEHWRFQPADAERPYLSLTPGEDD